MELYKENNKKSTISPTDTKGVLLKLVTSYSIFLFIILILLFFVYFYSKKAIYLILGGFFLIIGSAFIFYMARNLLQPIATLIEQLQQSNEEAKTLTETVNSQKPIICNSYINKLLSGTISTEAEADYIANYLGLNISDSSNYNVLYAVAYTNLEDVSTDNEELYEYDQITLNNIIHTALQKFFGENVYYSAPDSRTYTILLHYDTAQADNFVIQTQTTIREMHDFLLENHGIWLFAGLGKSTNSLLNVWEACQQAMEAVNYTTKNYIFLPYELIKKDSRIFYYPTELSTKMVHFITTGNKAQVMELFNLIHEENIEQRSLPLNLIRFLLSDIRNTLLKARFALPESADKETIAILDQRFNEHLTFQLCEDLALTLCKLFTVKEENEALATTIEKYIVANYKDPSLCLNKISDEFQISESYFSHMFKDKTGVNFSTYLEKIRMEEAVRLIKETDTSLNELYIAVGYNNQNSFRRAFKKIYGVTPSSMR